MRVTPRKGSRLVRDIVVALSAFALLGCGSDQETARDTDSLATIAADSLSAGSVAEVDTGASDTLDAAPRDTTGAVYRGYIVFQAGRASFTSCGSTERSWVVDVSGRMVSDVYDRLATNSGDPVFFELRGRFDPAPQTGFGAAYASQITVFQVRRAALEGPACNEDLRSIVFRARGNEPFWSVDIGFGGIAFSDFGRSLRLFFPYAAPIVSDQEWRYQSANKDDGTHEITVIIREGECTDSMSGAYFTFAANVEVDGRAYTGCAMEGW